MAVWLTAETFPSGGEGRGKPASTHKKVEQMNPKKQFKNHDARCNYYSLSRIVASTNRTENEFMLPAGSVCSLCFHLDARVDENPEVTRKNIETLTGVSIQEAIAKFYSRFSC